MLSALIIATLQYYNYLWRKSLSSAVAPLTRQISLEPAVALHSRVEYIRDCDRNYGIHSRPTVSSQYMIENRVSGTTPSSEELLGIERWVLTLNHMIHLL